MEIETWGPGDMEKGNTFHVKTVRRNPAKVGHVTGAATYGSFLSSMLGKYYIELITYGLISSLDTTIALRSV